MEKAGGGGGQNVTSTLFKSSQGLRKQKTTIVRGIPSQPGPEPECEGRQWGLGMSM